MADDQDKDKWSALAAEIDSGAVVLVRRWFERNADDSMYVDQEACKLAAAALRSTPSAKLQADEGCICKGNWRAIVKETHHRIGRRFKARYPERPGNWTFFGIVNGDDDYYYGFCSDEGGLVLSTCVGRIEEFGEEIAPLRQCERCPRPIYADSSCNVVGCEINKSDSGVNRG